MRTAVIVVVYGAAALCGAPGCDKKPSKPETPAATEGAASPAKTAPKANSHVPPMGTAPPIPTETAAVSLDDKRRDRRGLETGSSAPAKNLFADAPKPPPVKGPPPKAGSPLVEPPPVDRAKAEPLLSRAGLLAAHLKTTRKLRAGILSSASAVAVYDHGQLRASFPRKALIDGDGRWVSAMVVAASIPPLDAVTVRGGLGKIQLSPGTRLYYEHRDGRWRWTQLWRDPR